MYKYAYEGSGLQYELKKFINNVNNINKINESDDSDSKCRKVSVWTGAEACTNREISIATADVMENSSSGTDHRSRKNRKNCLARI